MRWPVGPGWGGGDSPTRLWPCIRDSQTGNIGQQCDIVVVWSGRRPFSKQQQKMASQFCCELGWTEVLEANLFKAIYSEFDQRWDNMS